MLTQINHGILRIWLTFFKLFLLVCKARDFKVKTLDTVTHCVSDCYRPSRPQSSLQFCSWAVTHSHVPKSQFKEARRKSALRNSVRTLLCLCVVRFIKGRFSSLSVNAQLFLVCNSTLQSPDMWLFQGWIVMLFFFFYCPPPFTVWKYLDTQYFILLVSVFLLLTHIFQIWRGASPWKP